MADEAAEEVQRRARELYDTAVRDLHREEEFLRLQRELPHPLEEENAAQMQFRIRDRRQEALNDEMADDVEQVDDLPRGARRPGLRTRMRDRIRRMMEEDQMQDERQEALIEDLVDDALEELRRRVRARRERQREERRIGMIRLRLLQIQQRDLVEQDYEMGREEARRVTDVMIREAQNLREEDESNPSSSCYSRHCVVCTTENPRQRAVYIHCGHIVCYSCAVDNSRSEATGGRCVFCRSTSGFVKLFEEECEEEKKNDVIDDNQSMINPDSTETADSSPRIPFALLFNGFVIFILAANITMFLRTRT